MPRCSDLSFSKAFFTVLYINHSRATDSNCDSKIPCTLTLTESCELRVHLA